MLEVIAVPIFRPLIPYFSKLFSLEEIKKAGLDYTIEEWTAISIFVSFLSSIFIFIFSMLFLLLMYPIVYSIIFSLSAFFITFSISIFSFKLYPRFLMDERKKRLDNSIHYASLYMSTIAGSGAPPQMIFKIMSKMKDLKEVSRISSNIVRDMDMFGLSLGEALEREARYSPSEKMKEMLWGIKTIITSGGNLQNYLLDKGRRYLNEYKRSLEDYSKTMSMLIEIYTTVVIVGAIFAIVLSSLMGTISGFTPTMKLFQYLTLVVGLPFATIIFIMIIKVISPLEV